VRISLPDGGEHHLFANTSTRQWDPFRDLDVDQLTNARLDKLVASYEKG
jgi:hypothetical protein